MRIPLAPSNDSTGNKDLAPTRTGAHQRRGEAAEAEFLKWANTYPAIETVEDVRKTREDYEDHIDFWLTDKKGRRVSVDAKNEKWHHTGNLCFELYKLYHYDRPGYSRQAWHPGWGLAGKADIIAAVAVPRKQMLWFKLADFRRVVDLWVYQHRPHNAPTKLHVTDNAITTYLHPIPVAYVKDRIEVMTYPIPHGGPYATQ